VREGELTVGDGIEAGDIVKLKAKFTEDDFHLVVIIGQFPSGIPGGSGQMVFWAPDLNLYGIIFGNNYEVIKIN
jgi:hypothetical protein